MPDGLVGGLIQSHESHIHVNVVLRGLPQQLGLARRIVASGFPALETPGVATGPSRISRVGLDPLSKRPCSIEILALAGMPIIAE